MRRNLRRLRRLINLVLNILYGCWLISTRLPRRPELMTSKKWSVIKNYMQRTCRLVLGINVVVHGETPAHKSLYVANHVSWHDIPVLGGYINGGFIAKAEISRWPVIGWMTTRGCALFIERGKHHAFHQTLENMQQRLQTHDGIILFPEGTTSDGNKLLQFKSRFLIPVAENNELYIQPVAIHYRAADQATNQHPLAFTPTESLFDNIWRTLGIRKIQCHIYFCEPIASVPDRRLLARQAQEAIEEKLNTLENNA